MHPRARAGVDVVTISRFGSGCEEAEMTNAWVVALCRSGRRIDSKTDVGRGELHAGWGLVGDSHAGTSELGRWQISLFAWEYVERLKRNLGRGAVPGSFAENLTTKGLGAFRLQIGDSLRIGDQVILEIQQVGKPLEIAHTYNFRGHSLLPRDGIFCGVVVGGPVAAGDEIVILSQAQRL